MCDSVQDCGRDTFMLLKAGTLPGVATRALVGASLALGSLFIAAVAMAGVAWAQGFTPETITEPEIEQRLKLARVAKPREPSREDVIADLRGEKRRLLTAQLAGVEATDPAVDAAYASLAKRMNLSPEQLTGTLVHSGVDAATLRQRIRADLAWAQYMRQKMKKDDLPSWQE
jgi:peptidyl-prolyl cis-trans isomerase SurA